MKQPIISLTAAFVVCSAAMLSCSGSKGENATPEISQSGDTIILEPHASILQRITTSEIAISDYRPQFTASGQVRAIPANYAEVGVPFAGRIAKSYASPGQKVRAGEPLFQISSSEYLEICRDALEAATELELAQRALARANRLFDSHMISARELEEAKADYDIKKQTADNAAASLSVFGGDIASIVPGQPMTVKSPISGTVIVNNLVNGQYVKDDAEPSVIVADLAKVWVVANVKERDFSKLAGIAEVDVAIDAWSDTIFTGRVYHINEMLDPATRTVELIVECDNPQEMIKPNMFCTVHLTDNASQAVLINNAAIRRSEDRTYVVKSLGDNRFVNCYIETGESVGDSTIVTSGLSAGEVIVTAGAFYFPEI